MRGGISFGKRMKIFLQNIDQNGQNMSLTLKNQHTFKTTAGGAVTLINGQVHTYEKENINRFLKISFSHYDYTYIVNSEGQTIPTRNITKCKEGRFKGDPDMLTIGMTQPGWYCLSNLDYIMVGLLTSKYRANFKHTIQDCANSTTSTQVCESLESIQNFKKVAFLSMAYLSSYFDQVDYSDNPIKDEINISYLNYKTDVSLNQLLTLKRNILTTYDHWLFAIFNKRQNKAFFTAQHGYQIVGDVKPGVYDQLGVFITNDNEDVVLKYYNDYVQNSSWSYDHAFVEADINKRAMLDLRQSAAQKQWIWRQCEKYEKNKNDATNTLKSQNYTDQIYQYLNSLQRYKLDVLSDNIKYQWGNVARKATDKINKRLDVIHLVKTIEKLKLAMKVLLNEKQRGILEKVSKLTIDVKNLKQNMEQKQVMKGSLKKQINKLIKSKKHIDIAIIDLLSKKSGKIREVFENQSLIYSPEVQITQEESPLQGNQKQNKIPKIGLTDNYQLIKVSQINYESQNNKQNSGKNNMEGDRKKSKIHYKTKSKDLESYSKSGQILRKQTVKEGNQEFDINLQKGKKRAGTTIQTQNQNTKQ
eukprot:403376818